MLTGGLTGSLLFTINTNQVRETKPPHARNKTNWLQFIFCRENCILWSNKQSDYSPDIAENISL
jgi:hypothetical protein